MDLVSFHAQLSGWFSVPSEHAGRPDLPWYSSARTPAYYSSTWASAWTSPRVILPPDLCLEFLLVLLHPDLLPVLCLELLLALLRPDLRPYDLLRPDLRLALLLLDPRLVLLRPDLHPVPSEHAGRPDLRLEFLRQDPRLVLLRPDLCLAPGLR